VGFEPTDPDGSNDFESFSFFQLCEKLVEVRRI
jgi:hypothetical protein